MTVTREFPFRNGSFRKRAQTSLIRAPQLQVVSPALLVEPFRRRGGRRAVLRPGFGGYDPLSELPDLIRYWDTSTGLGFSGSNVQTWTDQVVSEVLTASTLSYTFDGNAIQFAGSGRFAEDAADVDLATANDGTGGTVLLDLELANSGSTEHIYGPNNFQLAEAGLCIRQEGSTALRVFFGDGSSNVADLNPGTTVAAGRHIIVWRCDASQTPDMSLVVDGATYATQATPTNPYSSSIAPYALSIGNRADSALGPFSGKISAIGVSSSYLSDEVIAAWRDHRLGVYS